MKLNWNMIRTIVLSMAVAVTCSLNAVSQSKLEILPLGNSITRGSMCLNGTINNCDNLADGVAIGYRSRLYDLLSNAGYNFDFVGNYKYGYQLMSDSDNGGFDGIRSFQLASVLESGTSSHQSGQVTPGPYLNYYPADVILLHIGSNDILEGLYNVNGVSRILDAIDVYETSTGNPILVFLARTISLGDFPCNTHPIVIQFNNNLVSMAQSRINAGDHIVLVDMECGAGINYYSEIIDEVHPTQAGYDKLADKWFSVIDGYNRAPVVSQVPGQTVDRGSSFTQINLRNYVTDTEDSPAEITWSAYPATAEHFSVSINASGIATISAIDPHWSGTEVIEFVATDRGRVVEDLHKSDNCLSSFTINWMPEITGQQPLIIGDHSSLELTLDDLIIVEPEKAPAGLDIIVMGGSNYTVIGTTITPAPGFVGQLSVPVKLDDNGTQSNTYMLNVQVNQINYPPEITSLPVLVARTNEEYIYPVIAVDPDQGDVLNYSTSQKPNWMSINSTTGVLSGTPTRDDTGYYSVTLSVSDGQYSDEQSYTLEVKYVNQPPRINSEPKDTAITGKIYTYGLLASDADGDPMEYFASTLPDWLSFYTGSGVLIGIPDPNDLGGNLVILGVTDQIDTTYQVFVLSVLLETGISESELEWTSVIYPNPARDQIFIDLSSWTGNRVQAEFEMYDINGRKVLHRQLHEPFSAINLRETGLVDGIYLYRLIHGTGDNRLISGKIMLRMSGN